MILDQQKSGREPAPMWSDCVFAEPLRPRSPGEPVTIGVLPGEGIGPDVVAAALTVLEALETSGPARFNLRRGGAIGREAEAQCGAPLSTEVSGFCREVFAAGGAILAGAGGGRFVYDLRREFDLFCKITPLRLADALVEGTRLKPEYLRNLDMLVVRENVGGIYQGRWHEGRDPDGERRAEQTFSYSEKEVRRILEVAARLALRRRGLMSVIIKDSGIPTMSDLWRDCTVAVAAATGVRHSLINVDLAAYQLVQHPQEFDVVVAANLFGDVLGDLGGVLVGSRANSFSGNFSRQGAAVYQTNHGAGYDLVGKNLANPAGQIYSLAMLLRESFGMRHEAWLIEEAVAETWRQGWRTADLMHNGHQSLGTREMAGQVAANVRRLAGK